MDGGAGTDTLKVLRGLAYFLTPIRRRARRAGLTSSATQAAESCSASRSGTSASPSRSRKAGAGARAQTAGGPGSADPAAPAALGLSTRTRADVHPVGPEGAVSAERLTGGNPGPPVKFPLDGICPCPPRGRAGPGQGQLRPGSPGSRTRRAGSPRGRGTPTAGPPPPGRRSARRGRTGPGSTAGPGAQGRGRPHGPVGVHRLGAPLQVDASDPDQQPPRPGRPAPTSRSRRGTSTRAGRRGTRSGSAPGRQSAQSPRAAG